ncbi:MAG TPA: gamma-glutamyltransferase [Thermoanaerobaculia bacterium]|nr:gamma-glutamyltransferase [Thermoanaerobaculia bacterium]
MSRARWVLAALAVALTCCVPVGGGRSAPAPDLSPATWQEEWDRYLAAQLVERTEAGVATGSRGAVSVAYNGLAARAGLEALRQGGNAMDAALTAALAQVALTAGAPVSYFGILSLVYHDAATGEVHTLNAEWNTVLGEDDPASIPGRLDLSTPEGILGSEPSGRTALVGGFMKGVGAAHGRFGRLPFAELLAPSIAIAEQGFPVSQKMAGYWEMRAGDLARLPETRAALLQPDGSPYREGDVFRQPALAATLRAVAEQGVDLLYTGPWAEKLVTAVQADGGRMTLEDLAAYEAIWAAPLVGDLGDGYSVSTNPPPNNGGVTLIEAQHLARASGLVEDGHWSESGVALRKALDVTQLYALDFVPIGARRQMFPGVDFSTEARLRSENAVALWRAVAPGHPLARWRPATPASAQVRHSDDVVAIDAEGNVAALTQSINCVIWGKTAIVIDGITIGDPGSFQQAQIARAGPGARLESPTETGILFQDGEPVLGFASMGSGLHHRTFQGLLNVTRFDMSVDQAIDAPDFFMPLTDPQTLELTVRVPAGRFPRAVLEQMGYAFEEIDPRDVRFGGEGIWVAISRDPLTGVLRAASHNRNNSAAVAF